MRGALSAMAVALLAGCSHDWDAHERLLTPRSGAAGAAGAGGAGAAAGAGGAAECGNGSIEAGEECDDANDDPGDGCDGCVVECDRNGAVQDPATYHCYWLVGQHQTFSNAQAACEAAGPGVHLAAPSAQGELTLLTPLLNEETWLGGSDLDKRGTFVWLNGEPWSYPPGAPPWSAGEPNGSGDCVDMTTAGLLEDGTCGIGKDYLCERTPAGK